MAGKLVKRTLQLIGGSVASQAKNYTSNATAFINDAKEVKNVILKGETNVADTITRLKRTGITKKISDWFYGEEAELDLASSGGEEFDAGFKIDSSSDSPKLDSDPKPSKGLTADAMADIQQKQTGMMVKIGRRQTEQSITNTAEIISVVNNRSAEIIAAINNISTGIKGVNERLDKLIKINTVGIEAAEDAREGETDKSGLYQDGNLSLSRIASAAKNAAMTNTFAGQAISAIRQAGGALTPEFLLELAVGGLTGRKFNALGGKSIDEYGKMFNDTIGNAIQGTLNEFINSKFFNKYLGDITGIETNKDYGASAVTKYDNKRAQFDNMTRTTIVNIIPDLLCKINEGISGKQTSVSAQGRVVEGPQKNMFAAAVNSNFGNTGLTDKTVNRIISAGNRVVSGGIPRKDIDDAADALVRVLALRLHNAGTRNITASKLRSPDNGAAIQDAVYILYNATDKKDADYWARVCQTVLMTVGSGNVNESQNFVRAVNSALDGMIKSANEIANSNNIYVSRQASKITTEMLGMGFAEKYSANKAANNATGVTDGQKVQQVAENKSLFTTHDYVRGIFDILNRGVNVKIDNTGNKVYPMYDLILGKQGPTKTNTADGALFAQALFSGKGDKDSLKTAIDSGIQNALNNITGANTTETSGDKGLKGLFSGGFANTLVNLWSNRTLISSMKKALGEDGQTLKEKLSNVGHNIYDAIPYSIKNDQRFINFESNVRDFGNKANAKMHEWGNKGQQQLNQTDNNFTRWVGNRIYQYDTWAQNGAAGVMQNFNTSELSWEDQQAISNANGYIKSGNPEEAMTWINGIEDPKARKHMLTYYQEYMRVHNKRSIADGQIAKGIRPDIGAVQQEYIHRDKKAGAAGTPESESKLLKVVEKGFNMVGKFFKLQGKLLKSGIKDVIYGFGSAFTGMFGGFSKDPTTGKITRQHGFIEQLYLDPLRASNRARKAVTGGIANSRFGQMKIGRTAMYDSEGERLTEENDSSKKQYDESHAVTVGELLKNPLKIIPTLAGMIARNTYAFGKAQRDKQRHEAEQEELKRKSKMSDVFVNGKQLTVGEAERLKEIENRVRQEEIQKKKDQREMTAEQWANSKFKVNENGVMVVDVDASDKSGFKKLLGGIFGKNGLLGKGISFAFGKDSLFGNFFAGLTEGWRKKYAAKKAKQIQKLDSQRYDSYTNKALGEITDIVGKIRDSIVKRDKREEEKEKQQAAEGTEDEIEFDKFSNDGEKKEDDKTDGENNDPSSNNNNNQNGGNANDYRINANDHQSGSWGNNGGAGSQFTQTQGNTNTGGQQGSYRITSDGTADTSGGSNSGDNGGGNGGSGGILGGLLKPLKSFKGFLNGVFKNLGKVVGGIAQGVMGIVKIAMSVLMSMSAVQSIMDLVESILVDGLKPLNKALKQVYKMIKPLVKQLTGIVTQIAESLGTMLEQVLEVIAPLLEMVSSLIDSLFETALKPILEVLSVTLEAVGVPITIILTALKPVIEHIGNELTVASGVLQMGFGGVMTLLSYVASGIGSILKGIGKLVHSSAIKDAGKQIAETGSNMRETGVSMWDNGWNMVKGGLAAELSLIKRTLSGEIWQQEDVEEDEPEIEDGRLKQVKLGGTVFDNAPGYAAAAGSGDATTYNQHTYGNAMNMSERGCGPVALADAYNRRTGMDVNPYTLAAAMMGGSGNMMYNPMYGTSVAGMMSAGNAMGMNLTAAGVTSDSLGRASYNSPVTILGSGAGFGTKPGNDHYVNVLGSDGRGNSYISNPMSGRVEKHPTNELVLNSRLGLYGSGNADPEDFGVSDNTMDALKNLKELTGRFTKMFEEESMIDTVKKQISAGNAEEAEKQLRAEFARYGDDAYDNAVSAAEQAARDYFKENNTKSMSESEFEDAFAKWYTDDVRATYMNDQLALLKEDSLKQRGDIATAMSGHLTKLGDAYAKEASIDISLDDDDSSVSSWQGAVMSHFGPIRHKSTNITTADRDASPVHDYFAGTINTPAFSDDTCYSKDLHTPAGGWYKLGKSPNSEGEGSTGKQHEGVSFRYTGSSPGQVRAITSGVVTYVTRDGAPGLKDPNGGLGNSVKWRDSAGMYHWYLGLKDISEDIQEGSELHDNQVIGTPGETGIIDESQLDAINNNKTRYPGFHYIVTRHGPKGSTGDGNDNNQGIINPLMYWKYDEGSSADGSGVATGNTNEEKFMTYLISSGLPVAAAAGVLGFLHGESRWEPWMGNYKLQELGYTDVFNTGSKKYTEQLNNGEIDKNTFVNSHNIGPFGYGIGQFSMVRNKTALWDNTLGNSKKIDDLDEQLKLVVSELKYNKFRNTGHSVWDELKTATDPEYAARVYASNVCAGTGGDPYNPIYDYDTNGVREFSTHDAESWALAKSLAEKYSGTSASTYSNPAGINVNAGPRFISSMINNGATSSDVIKAMAMAIKAYSDNTDGIYKEGVDIGRLQASDGYVWDHFRPDCSGFMSAAIRKLGYDFKGSNNDVSGPTTHAFNENRDTYGTKVIVNGDGSATSDWKLLPFDTSDVQSGDFLFKPSNGTQYFPESHVGMYLGKNSAGSYVGLDGGSTDGIARSAKAAKEILSGNWKEGDNASYTIQPSNNPSTILRYLGKSKNDERDMSRIAGMLSSASQYGYNSDNAAGIKKAIAESLTDYASDSTDAGSEAEGVMSSLVDAFRAHNEATKSKDVLNMTSNSPVDSDDDSTLNEKIVDTVTSLPGKWYDGWNDKWYDYGAKASDAVDDLFDGDGLSNKFSAKSVVKSIFGKGDTPQTTSTSAFNKALPPIDYSKFNDLNIADKFNIHRDDITTTELLEKLSSMTFKVQDEKVEKLLEELVAYVKSRRTSSTGTNTYQSVDSLFDDAIPEAVVRLSNG